MSRVIAAFAQFFDGEGDPLVKGWLRFLVTSTNNTLKNTYADADHTIPNANPLQLDAEGRCPNVFGHGSYKVISYVNNTVTDSPGAQIQEFDPVISDYSDAGDCATGNFSEWDAETVYQVGHIVIYNGLYYRSFTASNLNNQPDTNPDEWEIIHFLRQWNVNVTYLTGDTVVDNNAIYFSLADANTGNIPLSSPAWWDPIGSGTVLTNWQEAGTVFRPTVSGYDLGDSSHTVGTLWLSDFASFPLTPSSSPSSDYQISNKKYVDDETAKRMRWLGEWAPGAFLLFDVVTDEGWLAIANTTTEERPAPQPIGEELWARDLFSPPAFLEANQAEPALYIGQRYNFTDPTMIRGLRLYFPGDAAGLSFELWSVTDPTGTGRRIQNIIPGFEITADYTGLWFEIGVGDIYIEGSQTVDLLLILRSATGDTSFTFEWDYLRANGDPLPGDIHHQSGNNSDQIRIHEQDTSLIDRTTQLDNIGPGSTVKMDSTGYIWEVFSASKTGDIYTFIVEPGVRSSAGTSDFTFTYWGSLPIYYVYNTNLYSSDARIKGYFATEYDPTNAGYINENGYGLDVKFQSMVSSSDWDIMSRPAEGGGSGSDAVTLQGYTPDEFAILADNETITGQWDFTGDTPTINSNIVYSAENGPISGHRNAVINGDFQVWQRGSSFTSSAFIPTADKWVTSGSGQTVTSTRTAFTPGQTDVPGNPKYYYRFAISSSEDNWYLGQLIEGVDTYAGEQVTLSAYIKSDNSKNITLGLQQRFGTGGSTAVSHNDTQTTTTGWVRYTFTTTLTSMSGKTIGTDSCLFLTFQAPTALTGYYDIARVRLEPGPVATIPEDIPIKVVLSMCQRYYQKSWKWDIAPGSSTSVPDTFSAGLTNSAYGVSSFHILPVVMYREPDITYWDNEGNVSRVRLGGTPNTAITDGSAQASDAWIGFDFTISPYVNNKVALHYELNGDIPLL